MHKTLVFTAFSPLCTHKDVEQENLSQAPMPFATKTVLSVLNVSAQPQGPKLEPLQARCTLNTPAPPNNMRNAENTGGRGTFQDKTTLQSPRSTLNRNAQKSQKRIPTASTAKG